MLNMNLDFFFLTLRGLARSISLLTLEVYHEKVISVDILLTEAQRSQDVFGRSLLRVTLGANVKIPLATIVFNTVLS